MKEVSCKVLPVFFKGIEKSHFPLDILLKNVPYDLKYLKEGKNYIEWDVFCQICRNSRSVWPSDEEFVQLGMRAIEHRVLPVLSAFLGFFLNTKEMYKLMFSNKNGLNSQLFRCITNSLTESDENHLQLRSEISEGYQPCREFYLISKGTFIAAPGLLKHKPADVLMRETERGAVFDIFLPRQSAIFTRLRQLFAFPASRSFALRELKETYELLFERYGQLEESNAKIQKQARQLETAFNISQLARSELDLDFMLHAVAESLVNTGGFAAVEINVNWSVDDDPIIRNVVRGNVSENMIIIHRPLDAHGHSFGDMRFWIHPNAPVEDAQQLLSVIMPAITMELFSAISFKLLDGYRAKLESNVDDIRSAILKERLSISSDLHDDLGSGLSKIALLSEQVRQNPYDEKSRITIEKIAVSAQEALSNMSEIVWSMNHRNDTLNNLIAYTRRYVMEYFEQTGIVCKVNIPQDLPSVALSGEKRRNIFLTIKEALHNIMKHSGAKQVDLQFNVHDSILEIVVRDNGMGFRLQQEPPGNGLRNMKRRIEGIGGTFSIANKSGTTLILNIPIS